MKIQRTARQLVLCLVAAMCFIYAALPESANAARRLSYITDPTFRLKNRKFLFNGVAEEDRKIHKMIFDSSGGVLMVGSFTSYASKQRNRILRLKPNLTLDRQFAPNVNGEIYDVALAPDGGIFIGGDFTTVDGVSRNGVARLLATGGLDTSFDPGAGANGFLRNVTRVLPFADGSVVISGSFSRVAGILATHSVAKLLPTGAVDTSFIINLATSTLSDGVRTIFADICEKLPGDKILAFGFGTDTSSSSTDGFQGSTVINTDGTRTESIKPANQLLTSYHHARGSFLSGTNGFGYISHEVFNAQFTPLSETLYRFDSTGQLDPNFKIKKKFYFTAVHLTSAGKFFIAPQTISSAKKITAKPLIERYSNNGRLEATLVLPKIPKTNFEYRNVLALPNGTILVHVRTVKLSKTASTGRVFTHYLMKVKRKK